jgi:hypothetical protein
MEPTDFIVSNDRLISILRKIQENPDIINNKDVDIDYIINTFSSDPVLFYNMSSWREHTSQLDKAFESLENCGSDSKASSELKSLITFYLLRLYRQCRHIDKEGDNSNYNSKNYFKNQISTFEKKITDLNQQLSESKQSQEQKEEITKDLEKTKEQLEQAKSNNAELEKRLDAQQNIKEKISNAFKELKTHISHLKKEKTRLNWMFGIYAFLSFVVFVMLIIFELKYLSKWETPTNWIDYLPFYIPVPIVGGLMWAFIYQMNRAQRQLIFVANELYHVDYVEGLLQAINLISPDAASASEKISHVLDILIKKHISIPEGLFEKSLDKEISKDTINVDTFIELAKKVKDVIK